jgi:hypothetical protein
MSALKMVKASLRRHPNAVEVCVVAIVCVLTVVAFGYLAKGLGLFGGSSEVTKFWDGALKSVGGLAALLGALVALSKYFDEREKENYAALLEAQKPFSIKRQEIYFQLVSAASTIGNRVRDEQIRVDAEVQFWWLFWGSLPMMADEPVGAAANAFSIALDEHGDDGILLRNESMNLTRACRKSLGFVEPEPI